MQRVSRRLALLTLAAMLCLPALAADKVNDPGASAITNQVFKYIKTREQKTFNNLIAGQHLGGVNELNTNEFDIGRYAIADRKGKARYPALIGGRYDSMNKGTGRYDLSAETIGRMNDRFIAMWQDSHPIIAITATPRNPWNQNMGRSPSGADQDLATLFRGAAQGDAWQKFWADANTIADGLKALQDEGIPVLFRPLAEVNTEKYYSPPGVGSGEKFKQLWREVQNFYVIEKGLHNLIFVWEAWVFQRNPNNTNVAQFWPDEGSKSYVDVVAGAHYFDYQTEYFNADGSLNLSARDKATFDNLLKLAQGKPFGAAQWGLDKGECSADISQPCAVLPPPDGDGVPYGDHRETLAFRKQVPPMGFVYYWDEQYAINLQANRAEFVSDPAVATLDDLQQSVNIESTRSASTEDGTIQEGAAAGTGGTLYNTAYLRTGDDANNRQSRAILSFPMSLPANTTITGATLRLKRASAAGERLIASLGNLTLDMAVSGSGFGQSPALEIADFETTTGIMAGIATAPVPAANGDAVQINIPEAQLRFLPKTGVAQFRARFANPTNGNGSANFVNWYAGNDALESRRPLLVVSYRRN
jgi:Glycosyl hydrolase family 26